MFEFIIRYRQIVLMLTLIAAAGGVAAWTNLPVDAFPDTTNQQVMILTEADGLGPDDVEQQVTIPIEITMGGLPGVKLVRSMSKTALSQVVVIFDDGIDTYLARQLVSERLVMAAADLPEGVGPELGPISTGLGEVFQYTLKGDAHTLTELRTMQDKIITPRLRAIPGVNEVNSFGGLVRQIDVVADPDRLTKFGLTTGDVVDALGRDNANAGGSFVINGWEQENIRNVGQFKDAAEIADAVLSAVDGSPVRVADVAQVREGFMTRLGGVSRDGRGEAVAGMAIMLKGENAAEVVGRIRAALPQIKAALPDDVDIDVFYDRTELVDAVLDTTAASLLQGAVFVIAILFLLLGNIRSALVTAVSIPVTALIAFIFMGAAGLSANLMSLGGLAIAVGMVVDGPIVITENITRHLKGVAREDRHSALVRAVREVARPIVFSVLIIVLVFVPLFTLEGMEGKMFKPLALTMVFAMLAALVAAMTIVPALMSFIGGGSGDRDETRLFARFAGGYQAAVAFVVRHARVTIVAAVVVFAGALTLIPFIGMEFLPRLDEGAIAINAVRLPNASLEGSVKTADYIEKALLKFPEVKTVVSKTGRAEISEDPMGPEQTDLMIMLHPEKEWTTGRDIDQLVAEMRETLEEIPGTRFAFSQPIALRVNELISGVKADLAVKIYGYDLERLKAAADETAGVLRGIAGARDVSVEQVTGFSQLEVIPDRAAMARYGISMADVNDLVETAVGGKVATELIDEQLRIGIQVRVPEDRRNSPEAIKTLTIRSPSGALVQLGSVADIRRIEGPAQISRENGMRRVVVEANVAGRDLGGFVDETRERLGSLSAELPTGYWLEYGGTFENQKRAMTRLGVVIPISIGLIFLMLLSALGSLRPAAMVLINLPFALAGGLMAMAAFGMPFNVPATIGFIAVFGIAVQNGTVLLTFIRQLRDEGLSPTDAVVHACRLRLRALLMTSATTVLGLLPMIYASGPGADIQRPLAVVVIGGLISSTVLTLFVLPSIYVTFAGKKTWTS